MSTLKYKIRFLKRLFLKIKTTFCRHNFVSEKDREYVRKCTKCGEEQWLMYNRKNNYDRTVKPFEWVPKHNWKLPDWDDLS